MLTAERHAQIRDLLAREGRLVTTELAATLGVSLDTVRRDLDDLEAAGALRRVRGGALPPATLVPPSFASRVDRRTDEKAAIADRAAELVAGFEVVLLGGGTTMVELARRWPAGRTTCLTPSLDVAGALLGRPGVEVVLLGGRVLADTRLAVGADTVAAIEAVRADACVLGTCSLDAASGITLYEREEALVAAAMIAAARATIVLADADKLGSEGRFVAAPADRLDTLVTDPSAPPAAVDALRAAGVEVVTA